MEYDVVIAAMTLLVSERELKRAYKAFRHDLAESRKQCEVTF